MHSSESLTKLLPALLKAKQQFKPALKKSTNPAFKSSYVDLSGVIDATDEALHANELMVLQGTDSNLTEKTVTVISKLFHTSGEWIETALTLPAGNQQRCDAQTIGSATTYGRRYTYMALLGIPAEDDDGSTNAGTHAVPQSVKPKPQVVTFTKPQESAPFEELVDEPMFDENGDLIESTAAAQHREHKTALQASDDVPSTIPAVAGERRITEPMAKRFIAIAKSNGRSWPQIDAALHAIGIQKANEIPSSQYDVFVQWAGAKAVQS